MILSKQSKSWPFSSWGTKTPKKLWCWGRPAIPSNQCGSFQIFVLVWSINLTQKWNTAVQIDILMLSWIAIRLHQDIGRFGATGLGKGELTDLKRPGSCFSPEFSKIQKSMANWEGISSHHPDWWPGQYC